MSKRTRNSNPTSRKKTKGRGRERVIIKNMLRVGTTVRGRGILEVR